MPIQNIKLWFLHKPLSPSIDDGKGQLWYVKFQFPLSCIPKFLATASHVSIDFNEQQSNAISPLQEREAWVPVFFELVTPGMCFATHKLQNVHLEVRQYYMHNYQEIW